MYVECSGGSGDGGTAHREVPLGGRMVMVPLLVPPLRARVVVVQFSPRRRWGAGEYKKQVEVMDA
jgi:hypothetical protein